MKIPKILNALDDVIIEEVKAQKERRKGYPYRHNPSSASIKLPDGRIVGKCLRQLYYKAKEEKAVKAVDTTNYLQMKFGDAIHNAILSRIQKVKGLTTLVEVGTRTIIDPLTKEVSFRMDGLATQDDGTVGGIEIKTTQGRSLTGKTHGVGWGIKYKGPKEDHLLQVISYFNLHRAIKWFVLIYLARDNAYRLEYHITRDGDKYFLNGAEIKDLNFEGIKRRWMELEAYIEKNEVPPRDFKVFLDSEGNIQKTKTTKGVLIKSDWQCLYCPYAEELCWNDPNSFDDSYNKVYKC